MLHCAWQSRSNEGDDDVDHHAGGGLPSASQPRSAGFLLKNKCFFDQGRANPKLVCITEEQEMLYQRDCADHARFGIEPLTRGQWLYNVKRATVKQPPSERRRKKTEAQRRRRQALRAVKHQEKGQEQGALLL